MAQLDCQHICLCFQFACRMDSKNNDGHTCRAMRVRCVGECKAFRVVSVHCNSVQFIALLLFLRLIIFYGMLELTQHLE